MPRSTRVGLCATVCAMAILAGSAVASAATIDHFSLDSYQASKKKFTPPATSNVKLVGGKYYVAVVQGTFSYYGAINYAVPQPPWTIVCGTPESAPLFGSSGGSGQVGFDSEFVFSRPWLPEPCAHAKLPVKWINFQMNNGTGVWRHPAVLGAPSVPSAKHVYEYAVVGEKHHHVAFRLYDINTRDNYGSLRISLRTATVADCAGTGAAAFGFASESECLTDIA